MQWFPNCGMRTTSGSDGFQRIHSYNFYLSDSVNEFLNFCVLPLLALKMATNNSCCHFVHVETISKLLIKWYFAHLLFLEQGGTCWHYRTHKWYVIRKSLGTTDLMQIRGCLPALKPWRPSSMHGTELLQMSGSDKQDMRSKLVSWLLQPIMFIWRQNSSNSYFAS